MTTIRTRRRLVVAAAALLVVLAAVVLLAYAAVLRPATNPPDEACRRPPADGQIRVLAAGSSTTRATLSADWVETLRGRHGPRIEMVNAGVNGDTAQDLLGRLDRDVLACDADAAVVLIGGNDARDGVPVPVFRAELEQIVLRLRDSGTTVALSSLPPQGEVLDSAANHRLAAYNAVIVDVAARSGTTYLPTHERLAGALASTPGARTGGEFSAWSATGAALGHYVRGRSWNAVSDGRGLVLLTDHQHLNDRGAELVATTVSEWLARVPLRG